MLTIRLTVLLAATLLFFIQPLIAKHLIPSFGGAYAVWSVVVVFFTTTLLTGYIYASVVMEWSRRSALLIHGGLLVLTAVFLWQQAATGAPLLLPVDPDLATPGLSVLAALIALVWLPTFTLASTSVLAQFLYAHATQANPYPLYSLSNVGSIIGLLVFPLVLELLLPLGTVAWIWFWLCILYLVVYGYSCVRYWPAVRVVRESEQTGKYTPFAWWQVAAIAAIPTFFMVALTEDLAKGIASFPLLWVVPLLLYLLSFVVAFSDRQWPVRMVMGTASLLGVMASLMLHSAAGLTSVIYLTYFVFGNLALFATATWLHRILYERRPATTELGTFYVWLTCGGALGSIVVSFGMPFILSVQIELVIFLTILAIVLLRVIDVLLLQDVSQLMRRTVLIFAGMSVVLPLVNEIQSMTGNELLARNFYGALKVYDREITLNDERSDARFLVHGSIVHGIQSLDPDYQNEAASYYGPRSGIDHAISYFTEQGRPPRVLVVGVGAGMMSAYCDRVSQLDYVDINPLMYEIAHEYFTYLEQCPEKTGQYVGDGRIWIEQVAPGLQKEYDLIMLDAFSDDAIPTHLLTIEAVQEAYVPLLAVDGVIAFHVSNKYLDLRPVLLTSLSESNLVPLSFFTTQSRESRLYHDTSWVLGVAKRGEAWFTALPEFVPHTEVGIRWTDEQHSILNVLSTTGSMWTR